ncbi:polyprenyl synthetase family protein [bacterium]|nr:polyprenyl synthetase family protein [bacterium]MBT4251400.1 polyprenyl synthetase family protein [bacterium]MBT4598136.1 polyprenyl synthetase family protein [bacterium]MBT6754351.1 polyprenyl synthetase family protein [bacterium]MBT7037274.1 polyprenyl synthetase family protein [bacterium]
MEALNLLNDYKERLRPFLEEYFKEKIRKAKLIDPLAEESVKMISNFTLAGGKRIRPAVMYYAYLGCGGKDEDRIVEASMSIELVHSFLLIHDDIIDKDELRHGVKTLNAEYEAIARKFFPKTDPVHFGNSMAMIAGDLAGSMASEIVFHSKFAPETIIKVLDKLQDIVYVTIPGEMIDVILEAKGTATEEEIMRMYEGKTSRYTFEGPSHLGALLANSDESVLANFTDYSMPLGAAFQIRDDVLGIFGEQKKLGKPVGSDIIEGKQTLLVIKVRESGTAAQKKRMEQLLKKQDITKSEIDEFRQIVTESGSLDYAKNLSEKLVSDSISALDKIDLQNKDARVFFEGIAHFIVNRQH